MSIHARDHHQITALAKMAKVLKGVLVAEKFYAVSMRNQRLAENGESDAVTVATNTAQQNDMAIRMHENLVILPNPADHRKGTTTRHSNKDAKAASLKPE